MLVSTGYKNIFDFVSREMSDEVYIYVEMQSETQRNVQTKEKLRYAMKTMSI